MSTHGKIQQTVPLSHPLPQVDALSKYLMLALHMTFLEHTQMTT